MFYNLRLSHKKIQTCFHCRFLQVIVNEIDMLCSNWEKMETLVIYSPYSIKYQYKVSLVDVNISKRHECVNKSSE